MKQVPSHERGAALLSVLLLMAVMAVIAAVMLERLNLAARLAGNGQAMAQARLYATSAESLAISRLKALVSQDTTRTVDRGGLLGREFPLPLSRGVVVARFDDAGNCFNVNSLVEGEPGNFTLRLVALQQLRSLMDSLEVDQVAATVISDSVADWIDSDTQAVPNGAEDQYYSALAVPYRTPNRLIGDVSEVRAVRGMTPAIYARLRPWLCALPTNQLSPVNVNTLRPDQARLVAMIDPLRLPVDRVRSQMAQRPAAGYARAEDFLRSFPAVAGGEPGAAGQDGVGEQLQVASRWFLLTLKSRVDSVTLEEEALIDSGVTPAKVAFRSWGEREGR